MCVIIVKKKGVSTPSKELLKACHLANPDGMGFATSSGYMWKGLHFGDFLKQLSHIDIMDDVIFHFRWATHGSISKKNCHPFKATLNDGNEVFFAHNGVLSIPSVNDMTDSEICFRRFIIPTLNDCEGNFEIANETIDYHRESSKFAFLADDGLRLYGDFVKYQDYLCSNTRFLWCMV